MDYIDVKTLYKHNNIALYCRVSAAGQDILKQISLAEIYLSQNNICINDVKRFIDNSVSANKLAIKERTELNRLLTEIKSGKVDCILVQARDRLARNFYEYIEIVTMLHKFNVKVIFTQPGHPPFSNVLSIEALYGIFPQVAGGTISGNTGYTHKRYPNSILGFQTIGTSKDKRYIPDSSKANELKSFFYSVIDVESPENLIDLLIKYKRLFNNDHQKALNCLQNPFYAGHIQYQDEYVPLKYVEPIISLEDFLKIQGVFKINQQVLQDAIETSADNGIHIPICYTCKRPMSFRKTQLGKGGYYVCAKKHPRIHIEVTHFNQLVANHLMDVMDKISVQKIKKDVSKHLLQSEKRYKQELDFLQHKLCTTQQDMTNLIGSNNNAMLKSLVKLATSIKEQMINLNTLLEKINYARNDIDTFTSIVKNRLADELQDYQIDYVSKLLFSKIEVSSDALIYHTAFVHYIEGNGVYQ